MRKSDEDSGTLDPDPKLHCC